MDAAAQLLPGKKIRGKWTGTLTIIDKRLGSGANGDVYLVRTPHGFAAMKICNQAANIAMEWSILEKLGRAGGVFPKPMLIDDDPDCSTRFYYLMEWIPGEPLSDVLPTLSRLDLFQVIDMIVLGLAQLHGTGHAFCDVKPQNILVMRRPNLAVRFVDVGGVTPFGRSVRQFTPFYDRAFWGLGSRQADAHYDLAGLSLVLLFAQAAPSPDLLNQSLEKRQRWLVQTMKHVSNRELGQIVRDVLQGGTKDAAVMHQALDSALRETKVSSPLHQGAQAKLTVSASNSKPVHQTKRVDWTERVMWASLLIVTLVAVVAWGTFFNWF